MPELGRVENPPDARDANHPMSAVLDAVTVTPPPSKMWRGGPTRINQGALGACVGFTGANWLQNWPTYTRVSNQTGFDLYAACKLTDGIPNIEGTYSRALMQVLAAQGRVARYLWANNPDELKTWVLTQGPVMVGTNWHADMFDPDANGLLHPTGAVVGGHEYLVRGYSRKPDAYRIRNSWGANWGRNGEAWIRATDLYNLVFNTGDAVAAIERTP